jgi:hypothetical protein
MTSKAYIPTEQESHTLARAALRQLSVASLGITSSLLAAFLLVKSRKIKPFSPKALPYFLTFGIIGNMIGSRAGRYTALIFLDSNLANDSVFLI